MTVKERIASTYLMPVVVIDDANDATATAQALLAGGVDIMEITLRTDAGLSAIEKASSSCPEVLIGAGTVLSLQQCKEALKRGAKFIVSPGYDLEIVEFCLSQNIDIFPGCVTPSEITTARNAGISVVKFFPASVYGGIDAIKALAAPFSGTQFIPTGGVNETNLAEFINPAVFAIGGGWLCQKKSIQNHDFDLITKTCARSVKIVSCGKTNG